MQPVRAIVLCGVLGLINVSAFGGEGVRQDRQALDLIIESLQKRAPWDEVPVTVRFTYSRARYSGDSGRQTGRSGKPGLVVYKAEGVTTSSKMYGTFELVQAENNKNPIAKRRRFYEDEEKMLSYKIWAEGSDLRGVGEGQLGERGCNCTEKLFKYPLTPESVVDILEQLEEGEVTVEGRVWKDESVTIEAEVVDRHGKGMWRIAFRDLGDGLWVPIGAKVFANGELVMSNEAEFDADASGYVPRRVVRKYHDDGRVRSKIEWNDIEIERGGALKENPDRIPPNVIVNDTRFATNIAYIMGNRPPTDEEIEEMMAGKEGVLAYQRATAVNPFNQRGEVGQINVVPWVVAIMIFGSLGWVILWWRKQA